MNSTQTDAPTSPRTITIAGRTYTYVRTLPSLGGCKPSYLVRSGGDSNGANAGALCRLVPWAHAEAEQLYRLEYDNGTAMHGTARLVSGKLVDVTEEADASVSYPCGRPEGARRMVEGCRAAGIKASASGSAVLALIARPSDRDTADAICRASFAFAPW